MELVTKTASAIAVGDELVTLIDWTNIEVVSGFTIIVENTGGGSGDDILDVQIDTSDDGGITPALDQFAGVPAVSIASGTAKKGVFTSSAKFVRVRAICDADKDTTANAWLMADSALGRICTLADVKDRLGISATEDDSLINRIITGLESIFNNYTQRKLVLNAVDETIYWTGRGKRLILPRYPIVNITSIKESWNYDFDNANTLTVNTNYRVLANDGILYRMDAAWNNCEDGIEIKYRGGYVAAGQTPDIGETVMPADLREAAILQTSFIYKRRMDIGLSAQGFMGGSINKFSEINLLPIVKDALENNKRLVL